MNEIPKYNLPPTYPYDFDKIIQLFDNEQRAIICCDIEHYVHVDRAVNVLYEYFKKHRPTNFRIDFEVDGKIEHSVEYQPYGLRLFVEYAIDEYICTAYLKCMEWIKEDSIHKIYDHINLGLYKHLFVCVRDFKNIWKGRSPNSENLYPLMERIKIKAEEAFFFDRVTVQLGVHFRKEYKREQKLLSRMRIELSEEHIQELWEKIAPNVVDSSNQKQIFVDLIQGKKKPRTKITFAGIKQNELGGLFYILYLFFHNKQENNIKAYTKTEIECWIIANYAINGVSLDNLNLSIHECFKRKRHVSEKIKKPEAKRFNLSFIDYTKEQEWREMIK